MLVYHRVDPKFPEAWCPVSSSSSSSSEAKSAISDLLESPGSDVETKPGGVQHAYRCITTKVQIRSVLNCVL